MSQLPFPLPPLASFAAEDYVLSGANQHAYDMVMNWPDWPDYGLWLFGPRQSGKSHLAALWVEKAQAKSPPQPALATPEMWLDASAILVELAQIPTQDEAEGLFHLLNHSRLQGGHILLTHRRPPSQLALPLADLASRLKALPLAELGEADDALLHAVCFKYFADRQLQVTPSVIDYLLQRCGRSFADIHAAVEAIDAQALQQQRAVTIPLVKQALGLD